jgi:hypothetical protein
VPASISKPPAARRSAKTAAAARPKPAAKATKQPFLRFYHSEGLRVKTLAVLASIEKAKQPTEHRSALAGVVSELTDSGMDYYFMNALTVAKVGFLTQQSTKLGMSATTGVLGSVIRNVIGNMNGPQLLAISGYIRRLMK